VEPELPPNPLTFGERRWLAVERDLNESSRRAALRPRVDPLRLYDEARPVWGPANRLGRQPTFQGDRRGEGLASDVIRGEVRRSSPQEANHADGQNQRGAGRALSSADEEPRCPQG